MLLRLRSGELGALFASCQAPKFFTSRLNLASSSWLQGMPWMCIRTWEGGETSWFSGVAAEPPGAFGERSQ